MTRARHSLELVQVRNPCPAAWEEMSGSEVSRFCTHCQTVVHNLSAMPRDEAERIVRESVGSLCVRMTVAPDGQVVTLDYRPSAPPRWRWRVWATVAVLLAVVTGIVQAVFLGKRVPAVIPVSPAPAGGWNVVVGSMAPLPQVGVGGAATCPVPAAPDGTARGERVQ